MFANPHFAAFLIDAEPYAGCLFALRTDQHHVRELQWRFLLDDAALHLTVARLLRTLVLLYDIQTLHNHTIFFGEDAEDCSLLSEVFPGDHLYGVTLLNPVHLCFNPSALQRFGRERHDLGITALTQFTRHGSKDARATWVLPLAFQDDRCIVIKANVRAIVAAIFFAHADDYGVDYIALFYPALPRGLFEPFHHFVTERSTAKSGAAHTTDGQ